MKRELIDTDDGIRLKVCKAGKKGATVGFTITDVDLKVGKRYWVAYRLDAKKPVKDIPTLYEDVQEDVDAVCDTSSPVKTETSNLDPLDGLSSSFPSKDGADYLDSESQSLSPLSPNSPKVGGSSSQFPDIPILENLQSPGEDENQAVPMLETLRDSRSFEARPELPGIPFGKADAEPKALPSPDVMTSGAASVSNPAFITPTPAPDWMESITNRIFGSRKKQVKEERGIPEVTP